MKKVSRFKGAVSSPAIRHPHNAGVMALLKSKAVLKSKGGCRSPWDIDEYELHTHPDLRQKLQEIAGNDLAEYECAVYGYPVLAGRNGVVFAVAQGTGDLALRLPAGVRLEAVRQGGTMNKEYGDEWVTVDPWRKEDNRLKKWCLAAHRYAEGLSR